MHYYFIYNFALENRLLTKTNEEKMKKVLLMISFSFLLGVLNLNASEVPDLEVGYIDPHSTLPGHGKTSVQVPTLWLDDHTLTFPSVHPVYSLDIILNGIVVYSVDVDESTSSVVLPSWLSGEYELQLYPDGTNYYFYGFIYL